MCVIPDLFQLPGSEWAFPSPPAWMWPLPAPVLTALLLWHQLDNYLLDRFFHLCLLLLYFSFNFSLVLRRWDILKLDSRFPPFFLTLYLSYLWLTLIYQRLTDLCIQPIFAPWHSDLQILLLSHDFLFVSHFTSKIEIMFSSLPSHHAVFLSVDLILWTSTFIQFLNIILLP